MASIRILTRPNLYWENIDQLGVDEPFIEVSILNQQLKRKDVTIDSELSREISQLNPELNPQFVQYIQENLSNQRKLDTDETLSLYLTWLLQNGDSRLSDKMSFCIYEGLTNLMLGQVVDQKVVSSVEYQNYGSNLTHFLEIGQAVEKLLNSKA